MLPPPDSTRLVTIIAHVDHGKTTLADNLIESNGIISERLAGTLRYLDSDPEEQRRGITMRASAIGLRHSYVPPKPRGGGGTGTGTGTSSSSSSSQQSNKNGNGSNASSAAIHHRRDMVVHLIDSPGHVDFSAEVTSSLLLCDSAILVVDAVEGLCARTHSLVREAYLHRLVPILVINKVDRLCVEMGLDVTEAYVRMRGLVETVNAVCASMLNSAVATDADDGGGGGNNTAGTDGGGDCGDGDCGDGDIDDDDDGAIAAAARDADVHAWDFDPAKGNVVFASALHGWGFTVPTLARSLFRSGTVPLKPPLMRRYLFGDTKYNAETGKVLKWKHQGGSGGVPMFAEYALGPLWEVYEGVSRAAASAGLKSEPFAADGASFGTTTDNDGIARNNKRKTEHAKIEATTPGMERVVSALQAGSTSPSIISPRPGTSDDTPPPRTAQELQAILSRVGAGSESSVASAVLRRYRPLSDAILDAVCEVGPSPADASSGHRRRALALRIPRRSSLERTGAAAAADDDDDAMEGFRKIQEAARRCDTGGNDVPTVAHVCKFTSTSRAAVTDPDLAHLPPSANILMGLARVLSGTLRSDYVEYYAFGPRYDGCGGDDRDVAVVPRQRIRCYLLMGSSFIRVDSVPAGHICAIYNLEALQLKTVTLSDRRGCMPLRGFDFGLQPLVKVNVEPVSASGKFHLRCAKWTFPRQPTTVSIIY